MTSLCPEELEHAPCEFRTKGAACQRAQLAHGIYQGSLEGRTSVDSSEIATIRHAFWASTPGRNESRPTSYTSRTSISLCKYLLILNHTDSQIITINHSIKVIVWYRTASGHVKLHKAQISDRTPAPGAPSNLRDIRAALARLVMRNLTDSGRFGSSVVMACKKSFLAFLSPHSSSASITTTIGTHQPSSGGDIHN
jgi:hypothetical protein